MQHLWHSFGDYRKRVNQSWLRQEAVLDQTQGLDMKPEAADDMGDIIIKGDESHTHHHREQSSTAGEVLKLVLASAIGAGACWYFLNQPQPTPTERPDANWMLDLKVTDEP